MEFNVFRDYCKAENSDDEEIFNDLQSRLYAEIYYGSNDVASDQNLSNSVVKCELERNSDSETRQESNVTGFGSPKLSTPQSSHDNTASDRCKTTQKPSSEVSDVNHDSNHQILPPKAASLVKEEISKDSAKSKPKNDEHLEESEGIVGVKKESYSILKKYEFSKPFINKLYKEKYQNLTETLKLIGNVEEQEEESKYKVMAKCTKKSEEVILTSDSDSEDSILEVPIPPKPQPPVINLHDSDLDSDEFDFDSRKNDEMSEKTVAKESVNASEQNQAKVSSKASKKGASSIDDAALDLMLNCTELQKAAGSLKEIRNMSKTLEENVNYERDKNFAEDVMVANFVSPKCRKRKLSTSNENFENVDEEKTEKPEEDDSKRLKSETWQDYFFRPMSDNLKAFYNESRGQENFNVEEIQSKMSRDPRLWAILDEDLMPDLLKRQRYWNVRCNNCKQPGHQKNNCPEPYKTIRCHICGAQGHIETRCPQKMCLTCGKKQGTFRKTCESCRSLYCNMCNAIGHKSTECPDLWRRFHQTTQINEINVPENLSEVMKPADLLYCCNCTKRGHDSSTCGEFRWSQHFPTPSFVSSYTSGPQYLETSSIRLESQSSSKDIIPLTKTQKKSMIFLPSASDHIESSRLVYSFGSFYTKYPNGEEIERKLAGEQVQLSHMTNLLKGSVSPVFLDELSKLSKFEIKIYYNSNNELVMRVRSLANLTRHIFELFVFWLRLAEEDKKLKMHVNLPRNTKMMRKLLVSKLEDMQKDLQDPRMLSGQIKQLKRSLNFGENQESNRKKLLELQWSLLKVFHMKPKSDQYLQRLRKAIRCLKQASYKPEVQLENYFCYVVIYNKVFLPRNLTEVELQRFLKRYYKTFSELDESGAKKKKKKKKAAATPYETFLTNLQKKNSNMIQVQITENEKSTLKVPQYVEKPANPPETRKTEKVASEGFQCPTLSIDNGPEKAQKATQINIGIKIPEMGGQNPNYSNYGGSGISVSSEISVQSVKSSEGEKKSKKGRKKSTETENFEGLEEKASIIMKEALQLNAPYMNRAVDEIRKKMSEKILKQEHIDTLQRLINLEKEHRNYVSSFCNYLQ